MTLPVEATGRQGTPPGEGPGSCADKGHTHTCGPNVPAWGPRQTGGRHRGPRAPPGIDAQKGWALRQLKPVSLQRPLAGPRVSRPRNPGGGGLCTRPWGTRHGCGGAPPEGLPQQSDLRTPGVQSRRKGPPTGTGAGLGVQAGPGGLWGPSFVLQPDMKGHLPFKGHVGGWTCKHSWAPAATGAAHTWPLKHLCAVSSPAGLRGQLSRMHASTPTTAPHASAGWLSKGPASRGGSPRIAQGAWGSRGPGKAYTSTQHLGGRLGWLSWALGHSPYSNHHGESEAHVQGVSLCSSGDGSRSCGD